MVGVVWLVWCGVVWLWGGWCGVVVAWLVWCGWCWDVLRSGMISIG